MKIILAIAAFFATFVKDDASDILSRVMRMFGKPNEAFTVVSISEHTANGDKYSTIPESEFPTVREQATSSGSTLMRLSSAEFFKRAGCWVCERTRVLTVGVILGLALGPGGMLGLFVASAGAVIAVTISLLIYWHDKQKSGIPR